MYLMLRSGAVGCATCGFTESLEVRDKREILVRRREEAAGNASMSAMSAWGLGRRENKTVPCCT